MTRDGRLYKFKTKQNTELPALRTNKYCQSIARTSDDIE